MWKYSFLKFSLLKLSRGRKNEISRKSKLQRLYLAFSNGDCVVADHSVRPSGLTPQAWEMFAIFVATIVGCITKPLPIGSTTLLGMVVTVLVGIAPVKDGVNSKGVVVQTGILSSFGNSAARLIAMAFIMAHGISKTGLGNRVAYLMIKRFCKKSIGIGYAITGLELIMGALIPSNSARTGVLLG